MAAVDQQLMAYVNQALNSGETRIVVPASLLNHASAQCREEIRQLCKLNGVELQVGSG